MLRYEGGTPLVALVFDGHDCTKHLCFHPGLLSFIHMPINTELHH